MVTLKKIVVILMMGVLLFNWFGYRALTYYLQEQATRRLEVRLDNHQYREQDLVEIKIPLHLPYITPSAEFQRVDGEIDYRGQHYSYVKRRVYNDSLIILCVVNESRKKISDAGNSYFGLVNDLSNARHPGKESGSFFKTLLSEYQPEANNWSIAPLIVPHPAPIALEQRLQPHIHRLTPEQPPELV